MTESSPARVGSWAFWKKRLARLLVGLGLALFLTQWLPALPQDQEVVFDAPEGYRIEHLDLRYTEAEDGALLVGVSLHPAAPEARAVHRLRLPDGDVIVSGTGRLVVEPPAEGSSLPVRWSAPVSFSGGVSHVTVPPPGRRAKL